MDCTRSTRLIELEVEGALGADEALELERHVRGCAGCAALRAELLAIDLVLLEARLDRAPAGFAETVLTALERRRRARAPLPEPVVVALAAAVGLGGSVYGVARALGAGAAGAFGGWLRSAVEAVRSGAASLASRVPGLDAGLWDNPAAAGVLAALAAAGLVFFVVVLWRFPKQLTAEWR